MTSPKEIAGAMAKAVFADFDSEAATKLLADDYIQHNPFVPTGAAPVLGLMPMLKESGIKADVHRVFSEGNLVVFHSTYYNAKLFGGDTLVAFDVFRIQDGKVAEHWDNLQPLSGPNPSGHTMTDGAAEVTDLDKTATNKKLVEDFVDTVLVKGDVDKIDQFIASGSNYVQHNPMVGDGADFLKGAIAQMGLKYTAVRMAIAEGNFVLLASEGVFGSETVQVFYDLFRVADGKIVEHWDVAAPMPDAAAFKHENGKF